MSFLTPFFKSIQGAFGDGYGTPVEQAWDVIARFTKPAADGAAANATAITKGNDVSAIGGCFTNVYPYDLEIIGFGISPNAPLVADAANFATIAIATDDAADGAPQTAMQLTTTIAAPGSGNWATDVVQLVTKQTIDAGTKGTAPVAGARRLRPGANLFMTIAKSGAGVVVPICTIHVLLRRI